MTKMKTSVIYTRVSTEIQDYSRQIEELTKYSNLNGYNLLKSFDEKVSGTKDSDERKQLSLLMDFVNTTKVDIVLCWETSRLGRKTKDVLTTLDYFTSRGINVYLKKENIFTLNEDGSVNRNTELVLTIMAGISSAERETTLARSRSGLYRNSKTLGHWTGGKNLPYGYTKDGKKLVVDSEEAEIIKDIFKMYLDGKGTVLIANELNERNIPTRYNKIYDKEIKLKSYSKPSSEFRWVDGTIYSILTNSIYKGQRRYKGEVFSVEGIISAEVFDSTQVRLRGNFNKTGNNTKHFYLLGGIELKCGVCGKSYFAHKRTDKKDNRYICLSKRYKEECDNYGIGIDKLANSVWLTIKNIARYDFEQFISDSLEESQINLDIEKKENVLNELTKEINGIDNKENYLLDMVMKAIDNGSNPKVYDERILVVQQERKVIQEKIDNTTTELKDLKSFLTKEGDLNNQIRDIKGDKNRMKELFGKIIKSITIYPSRNILNGLTHIKDDKILCINILLKSTPIPIEYLISQRSQSVLILEKGEFDYENQIIIGSPKVLLKRNRRIEHHTERPRG